MTMTGSSATGSGIPSIKTFAPSLGLGNSINSSNSVNGSRTTSFPDTKEREREKTNKDDAPPSLSSPAKKRRPATSVLGSGALSIGSGSGIKNSLLAGAILGSRAGSSRDRDEDRDAATALPGLASPAKKRSRVVGL